MKVMNLLEKLSSVVFFFTYNDSALNIIKKGHIDLGLTSRNSHERSISKSAYFLSTTRSRMGGFHKDKSGGTLFTLDGNRLSQRYSAKPIDYFHGSSSMPDEMEDRIFTDQKTIPLLNYVTRADVHWSDNAKHVYSALRRRNIPVFVYENQRDWLLGNTKKAMSHEQILSKTSSNQKTMPSLEREQLVLRDIFTLYNAKSLNDIDYKSRTRLKDLLADSGREIKNVLNNIGINWKKRDHFSEQVDRLARLFKRENVTTVKEFSQVLIEKLNRLKKQEEDKVAKQNMIETLGKLQSMIGDIERGSDPVESATKHVHEDIKDYPVVLDNILKRLLINVSKFHTPKLEAFVKHLFPVLKNEDLSLEPDYVSYLVDVVMRDIGIKR